MRSTKRTAVLVAAGVAGALALTACGPASESADSAAAGDGTFSMFIGETENPLVPGDTTEDQGNQVVSSLWTGLVQYDEKGEVVYTGVADSITSDDATTWTVKLEHGPSSTPGTTRRTARTPSRRPTSSPTSRAPTPCRPRPTTRTTSSPRPRRRR